MQQYEAIMNVYIPEDHPKSAESQVRVMCHANGTFLNNIAPSDISELLTHKDHFVWLDIGNPGPDETHLLREEFGFHPLAIEDATRHHERPKVESYDGYYFLIFYEVHYHPTSKKLHSTSLALFIGPNYLVSVHDGSAGVVEETIARWHRNEAAVGRGGGALLYHLLDAIVDDYFPVIDQLAERVEQIEEQIFERFRQSALQEVFALKRDLLSIRRIVAPERDVLNVLIRREMPVFDQGTIQYLQDVYDHIIRITDSIDTYRDLLSSAVDAFLSIQSNQLNQIVKVLTITSIVLMTCALIAGIYGMNFVHMPELQWLYGYPFALGLMVVLSAGLIFFFKKRGWL
jgi:magnesium transporter